VLQVVVLRAGERDLADAIAGYAKGLDTTEHWRPQEAREALSVTDSPLVIPYLKKFIGDGYTNLESLTKFRGNHEAEELLIDTLRSGKPDQVPSALRVLQDWNYNLSNEDFETVMARAYSSQKIALLRYAEKTNLRAYIPAIVAHTSNADPEVANEAKRALDSLRKNGK
jgi:hypothetical protein